MTSSFGKLIELSTVLSILSGTGYIVINMLYSVVYSKPFYPFITLSR
jgi:hypothetical protein